MAKTLTIKEIMKALEGAEYFYIARLEDGYDWWPMSPIGKTKFSVWRERELWTLKKEDQEIATIRNVGAFHEDIAKIFLSVIKSF